MCAVAVQPNGRTQLVVGLWAQSWALSVFLNFFNNES